MQAGTFFKQHLTKDNLETLFFESIDGSVSPGSDGIRIHQFKENLDQEINVIIRKMKNGSYRFTSYREKLVSKGATSKPRQISIPTIRDKLALKFLTNLLLQTFPECQLRPPHQLVKKICCLSAHSDKKDCFLRLDVQEFYSSINHQVLKCILKRKIRKPEILKLIIDAIKTPTGSKKSKDNLSEKGVPQGLSISNILSSIYMIDADKKYCSMSDAKYFRFVDDILVIASKDRSNELKKCIPSFLTDKLKIVCHEVEANGKSQLTPIHSGISYLGYQFDGSDVSVREASYKKMFSNLMKLLTRYKHDKKMSDYQITWRLNLRISGCVINNKRVGWMFFFSQTNNMSQLKRLDKFIKKKINLMLPKKDLPRIKTFYRAYHEIRYKQSSNYYVNFDEMDFQQQKNLLKQMLPTDDAKDIENKSNKDVDKLFWDFARRESAQLERDVFSAISS